MALLHLFPLSLLCIFDSRYATVEKMTLHPSCVFDSLFAVSCRYLHHNFVCALLNDLFGIQARAGCQCAGPYGVRLLSMSDSSLPKMKRQVEADVGIMKPGFCRLSLTFFMSDAEASLVHIGITCCVFVSSIGVS